jgi:hypothetical protein
MPLYNPSSGGAITVAEEDGTPSVSDVTTIEVPNGTLTDDGGGTVSLGYGASNSGQELDYVEITTGVTITGTAEGSETTVITGTSQAYDGTTIMTHFYSPGVDFDATAAAEALIVVLYDGATILGRIAVRIADSATSYRDPIEGWLRITPTVDTHQYIVKAYKATGSTAAVGAGAGGSGVNVPAFLRITQV